jgi:AraC-like DNA-binding protein
MLLNTRDVTVVDVHCPTTSITGPMELQGLDCFELLFVRSGCFTFQDSRGRVFADPTTCVLGPPRQLADIAHPAAGGDIFTQISLSAEAWHEVASDDQVPLASQVTGGMQIEARSLLVAGRRGVGDMAVEEGALNLVAAALAQEEPARIASGRPSTNRRRRQLTEDARVILTSNPALASIREIAVELGCSPYHLSRTFRAHTGKGLAEYRTQLRVNLALQFIADGGMPLAEVASQTGFADQAHLTRTVRDWTGRTPDRFRRSVTNLERHGG